MTAGAAHRRDGGHRVVVTGMGGVCALGETWSAVAEGLRKGKSGVRRVPALEAIEGLRTRLGAPVDFEPGGDYPRKKVRGMGRVALLATRATELALADAGLLGAPVLSDGRTGAAYGSTGGSAPDIIRWAVAFGAHRSIKGLLPTQYPRLMSHTTVANLAQFFEIRGRAISTCSACSSGSQAIGTGYEAIRFGRQDVMLCGGAEEFHVSEVAVFDMLLATSTRNDRPQETPRPFHAERDGLVVGEGAATLVLESLEHARARGAAVLAEVAGYGTNCDGYDLLKPDRDGMREALRRGLQDAGLGPTQLGFVCAHATATDVGDIAESHATHDLLGARVPVFSLKGHLGHTLGACGALESWFSVQLLREGWIPPTLHLDTVDSRCAELDYVCGEPRGLEAEYAMSNNFAFGGVNSSLIFRRWNDGEG